MLLYIHFHSSHIWIYGYRRMVIQIKHVQNPTKVLLSTLSLSPHAGYTNTPHAQILNPPKSRQEMPSSVEQNAFDRPPLLFLSLLSPPPLLNDICALHKLPSGNS